MLDDNAADLVGDVIEAIGHLLEMIVDFGSDDEIHRAGVTVFQEQLFQTDVVEIVDATFQLGELFCDGCQQCHVTSDRLQQW